MSRSRTDRRDDGTILPLVLIVAVVLAAVVVALARFVAADLAFSRVTEGRAERRAAATSAITFGVERLRLGQALCNAPTPSIGPVPAGLLDRNGTSTTLTCSRFGAGFNDITGWAVVITGNGISTELLRVQGGGVKRVTGPMYINDVTDITFIGVGGPALEHRDGDLFHYRATCPGAAVTMPPNYTFVPSNARGPICTSTPWTGLVTPPTIPNLNALPVNDGTVFTPVGTCRVFSPGRYTGPPSLGAVGAEPDVYFRSGLYWFDNVGLIEIKNQSVWFGHNRSTTPLVTNNSDCNTARLADQNVGGSGAVAYLGGNSQILVRNGGSVEFFDRTVGEYQMSIQQLQAGSGYAPSTITAASNTPIIEITGGSAADLVLRGVVYAPDGEFRFDNSAAAARQQLLGGAVVARMSIQAAASASGFVITSATTPVLAKIEMVATSTDATGGSTQVRAVVDYRPDVSNPLNRVAINSLRVVG